MIFWLRIIFVLRLSFVNPIPHIILPRLCQKKYISSGFKINFDFNFELKTLNKIVYICILYFLRSQEFIV